MADDGSYIAFAPALVQVPKAAQGATQLIRGLVAILHGSSGDIIRQTETDPEDLIRGRAKVKISTDKKDDTRVLKVVDAIKCIEEFLNGDVVRDVLMAIVKGQLLDSQGPINNAFDVFAAAMTLCIREKALKQTIERVNVRVTPSRGPGRPKGSKNGTRDTGYSSRRRGSPGAG